MRFTPSLWNIRGEGALVPQGHPYWNNLRYHSALSRFVYFSDWTALTKCAFTCHLALIALMIIKYQ